MNKNLRRCAVYPGTFDPLTLGHLDVIGRAAGMFDRLILGIGVNASKDPFFSSDQRLAMVYEECQQLKNVEVKTFSGLAVDFAKHSGAGVIIRGLRTEADYAYEMPMAMMNHVLSSGIDTIFIPTRQKLSHISSAMVKEVASLGGNISGLVPPAVLQGLKQRFAQL